MENKDIELPRIPSGKGQRLIILHAGSDKIGFIEGCKLVFSGKSIDGDYHREMNSKIFLDWFENRLLPALEEPSLIVLDNASYHNVRTDYSSAPTSSSKKSWLKGKNIEFSELDTKGQLYKLVKTHKPPVRYITDDLAGKF